MSLISELDTLIEAYDGKKITPEQAINYLRRIVEEYEAQEQKELDDLERNFYADKTH